jgi:hypothetical protein
MGVINLIVCVHDARDAMITWGAEGPQAEHG